jgi:branched-chain amino acid transport system permease protein
LGGQSVLNNNLVLGVILIVFVLLVPKGVAPTIIDWINARRKKAPTRTRRRRGASAEGAE